MTMNDVIMTPERWQDRWEYYRNEPQQVSAIWMLYDYIKQADPALLSESAEWATRYSEKLPALPAINPMPVPYFSQLDNASGTGYRECFSSSCAMVAAYYGKVNTDDEYNRIRAKYGDTTSADAQIRALRELGLTATFHTNGNPDRLKDLIDDGIPVPCGWLHHGHVSNPSGGGHYSVVIGYEANAWIHNDPNGQADLVKGGYTPDTNGHGERYSFQNWNLRWECDGASTGWYMRIVKS